MQNISTTEQVDVPIYSWQFSHTHEIKRLSLARDQSTVPSLWSETTFYPTCFLDKKRKRKKKETLLLEKSLAELSIQHLRKMAQYSLHLRVTAAFSASTQRSLQHKSHSNSGATYATVTFSVDNFRCLSAG